MATSQSPTSETSSSNAPPQQIDAASAREARDYWGYLFQKDKRPTEKLKRLLNGIAACIADEIDPHDSNDLNPSQMAGFYRSVGGDYDPLFRGMPLSSISFIYTALCCVHSLQPDKPATDYTFAPPTIPALKPRGFVTWQSIQLLLGPQEHVPFIQRALKKYNIKDPDTGEDFPKILPAECFPEEPDAEMVAWHHKVSDRLKREADQIQERTNVPARIRRGSADKGAQNSLSSTSSKPNTTAEERTNAADFFARNPARSPGIVKRAQMGVKQGSHMILRTAKNVANPHLWDGDRSSSRSRSRGDRDQRDPRSSRDRRDGDSQHSDRSNRRRNRSDGRSDTSPARSPRRNSYHDSGRRPPPRRRSSSRSVSPTGEERRRHRNDPNAIRRHKSHEPPMSPREYEYDSRDGARRQQHDRFRNERPDSRRASQPSNNSRQYYDEGPTLRHHRSSQDTYGDRQSASRRQNFENARLRNVSDPRQHPGFLRTDSNEPSSRHRRPSEGYYDEEPPPARPLKPTIAPRRRQNPQDDDSVYSPMPPDDIDGPRFNSNNTTPLVPTKSKRHDTNNNDYFSPDQPHAYSSNARDPYDSPAAMSNASTSASTTADQAQARPRHLRPTSSSTPRASPGVRFTTAPEPTPKPLNLDSRTPPPPGASRDDGSDDEDNVSEWWNEDDENDSTAVKSDRASSQPTAGAAAAGTASGGVLGIPPPPPSSSGGSSHSQSQQQNQNHRPRPNLVKHTSAVGGVSGRAYPNETPWR